jgi:hypothetical protein
LLVINFVAAFSQQDSTTVTEQKTITGSLREKLSPVNNPDAADSLKLTTASGDSLQLQGSQATDSVDMKINEGLENVKERIPNGLALDTLKEVESGENLIQKVDSIQHVPDATLSAVEEKLNRPKNAITQKADSLTALLEKPAQVVNEKIDSALNKVNARVDSLENKVLGTVERTESKIQDKVNTLTDGETDVPGLDKTKIPDVGINETGISTESPEDGLDLGGDLNVEIPGLDTESLNLEVPEIETLDVNKSLDIPDTGKIKEIGDVKQLDEVQKATDGLDDVDRQLAELEKYENELRKAKEADLQNLEKRSEAELMKIDEVGGVAGEAQKAAAEQAKYQAMVQKYSDKKLLEAEIQRKAKNVVTDKLNHLTPAFQEAQEKIAVTRKKYDEVASMKDLPKRRSNDMRGKAFYQRLLPGATLQVYNSDEIIVDAALQVGYRFTERLIAGLGGVYRIAISDQYEYYVRSLNVFGGRTYLDWTFRKGFFLHGEFEALKVNADPTIQPATTEEIDDYAYNAYAGIGKQFNISRRIKGTVLGIYRFELAGYTPEFSKVNVRLGFHYDFAKKKKKPLPLRAAP